MTHLLYAADAYATRASGIVTGHTEDGGVLLDQSLFYATGGGQPGDGGVLRWSGGDLAISTAIKTGDGSIALKIGRAHV